MLAQITAVRAAGCLGAVDVNAPSHLTSTRADGHMSQTWQPSGSVALRARRCAPQTFGVDVSVAQAFDSTTVHDARRTCGSLLADLDSHPMVAMQTAD